MSVLLRLFQLRTTPGRVRALTAAVLLALAGLIVVTGVAVYEARQGLRAVGKVEGPTVVATSDVYLALSDMDVQVTNVLLNGREDGWLCDPRRLNEEEAKEQERAAAGEGCTREFPREFYELRREDAQRAALQAAELADGDSVRLRTVRAVLDGLQRYDRQVQEVMGLGRRARHDVGAPPRDAVMAYRSAAAVMTDDLLPQAYNLTLDSAAQVDSKYEDKRSATLSGRARVLVTGLTTVALLLALQAGLALRFRRVFHPLLALATAGTLALAVAGASLLATEADQLRIAKGEGFDPLLRMTRTQAFGKGMDADRGRFLLDPEDGDRHDQTYLEKSQTVLYIPGVTNLEKYYAELTRLLDRYDGDGHPIAFGGFYGAEGREAAAHRRKEDLRTPLTRYLRYQDNDRRVRDLAMRGKRKEAAQAHMDPGRDPDLSYLPHPVYREHDESLAARIGRHQDVVDSTVRDGERAVGAWTWLPPVAALAIAGLVVTGVRLRLSEYR